MIADPDSFRGITFSLAFPSLCFRVNDMYLPLLLKDGFSCLVIGGGRVAARKMGILQEMSCKLTVIAPSIAESIEKRVQEGSVRWIQREYVSGDCRNFQLIIAATPSREVNRDISEEARQLGIPVNVVDDPALSTVIFPAVWRDKSFVLAVSTEGVAPFMASRVRTRLAKSMPSIGDWIEIAGKFRAAVRKEIQHSDEREKYYSIFPDSGPVGDSESPSPDAQLSDWLSWLELLKRQK
jgi:uroporphyrin-III C-methyltransferase / precorrin-2 dehydrogenase / sirohydrochlorin ferrochelatase